ncbi:hypothetical protein ACWEFL_20655 [Streptomyces sp. NPDC004838]
MTTDRSPVARAELAGLLTEAAQKVSGILTAEYPTPASCYYLHPVLGVLSAGPQVVCELADRLEGLLDAPLPATPAGLFTLASYAAALGWLTESLAELTASVDQICARAGIPTGPPDPVISTLSSRSHEDEELDFGFSSRELAALRSAAVATGLTSDEYLKAHSWSLLAAARITDACTEISSGLVKDAQYILSEAADHVRTGEGPDSLPTLVRSLLARMEAAE